MCGITGIISHDIKKTGPLLEILLQAMQHRGPDGAGILLDGQIQRKRKITELNFKVRQSKIGLGHVRLAITSAAETTTGIQPFQSRDKKITLLHNGEIYNFRELKQEIGEQSLFQTDSDSEVIIRLIEKNYNGNLLSTVTQIIPFLDGVFALAITDNKQIVIARDRIGVRQIYYYNGPDFIAFASERKPLMAVSNQWTHIRRLLPGQIAQLSEDSFKCKSFWQFDQLKSSSVVKEQTEAIKIYKQAIEASVAKRVRGRRRVGIIFSGGVDSLLVAYLVKKLGTPYTCYTAGLSPGSGDIDWSVQLAEKYGIPLKIKKLTKEKIKRLLPNIIKDIEDYSFNQVEVAVPIYAAVRMAQEEGERVLLTGQGADELFGGYPWYSKIVDQEGYEEFVARSFEDMTLLYKECLEREDKIAMAHSIELRVPFLDPEVIKAAFAIDPQLKIKKGGDRLAKRIHRYYCTSIGITEEVALRVKEAAQHGANVHTVFLELAAEDGLTKEKMDEAGYDINANGTEILGSSSRYGYRYGQTHLWEPLKHVQYYLDSLAEKQNLMNSKAKAHWQKVTNQLQKNKRAEI
jgi:asparagine synthase (glutamine-hydrolysing)